MRSLTKANCGARLRLRIASLRLGTGVSANFSPYIPIGPTSPIVIEFIPKSNSRGLTRLVLRGRNFFYVVKGSLQGWLLILPILSEGSSDPLWTIPGIDEAVGLNYVLKICPCTMLLRRLVNQPAKHYGGVLSFYPLGLLIHAESSWSPECLCAADERIGKIRCCSKANRLEGPLAHEALDASLKLPQLGLSPNPNVCARPCVRRIGTKSGLLVC